MMKYLTIHPGDILKDFVSHFWISEFEGTHNETFNYLSTADSCCKVVFIYQRSEDHKPSLFSAGVQGQTDLHGVFPTTGSFEIFGINIFPHALPFLMEIQASELSNQLLDFEVLLGQKGMDLIDRMSSASNHSARTIIVRDFFEKQLLKNYMKQPSIVAAIKFVNAQRGLVDIAKMHEDFCLSQKQFERKFKEWAGFTPKLYSRIVRFESILCDYNAAKSLTEIAYRFGYFDQSHFIKEFKQFSGHTPSKYFSIVNK